MHERIETGRAPRPIGPYSQAVRARGFIFVSGQIPIDPATGLLAGDDVAGQTRRVMANIGAILEEAGSSLRGIVKTTIYLKDLDDFDDVNRAYAECLGEAKPARATVQVSRLPRDVKVEIEAVALA